MKAESMKVVSLGVVQDLYEAARGVVENNCEASREQLKFCVEAMEEAAAENDRLQHIREMARKKYADPSSDDIEVDDFCFAHANGDGEGYWVGAWLFVAKTGGTMSPPP